MKRFFLLTVSALYALLAFAQEGGPLEGFAASLASGEVSFKYSFEVKGDIPMTGNGTAALRGASYHVFGNGMDLWCDGKTRWTIDRNAREAYIEAVDPDAADYLSNPASLLSALDRAFEVQSVSDVTLSGKKLRAVKMTPAETLFRISGYSVKEKSDAAFSFDIASLGAEYVVTDLR